MKYWIKAHSFHGFETVVVVVPQGRTSVIFKVFAQVSYFSFLTGPMILVCWLLQENVMRNLINQWKPKRYLKLGSGEFMWKPHRICYFYQEVQYYFESAQCVSLRELRTFHIVLQLFGSRVEVPYNIMDSGSILCIWLMSLYQYQFTSLNRLAIQ